MTAPRLTVALALVVVGSAVGVGAATPSPDQGFASSAAAGVAPSGAPAALSAPNASGPPPMGANISMFMQANLAQAEGAVENGMWVAAYANASNASAKRALVERRVGELNTTVTELQAERRALQAAFRNGSINRTTYLAELSVIVGRLAALGESLDDAGDRGRAVGVDVTRLDELRTQARELGGAEVAQIARSLAGDRGPPGQSDLFGDGPPGQSGANGPPGAGNRSNGSTSGGPGDGPADAGNETGGTDTGPPTDAGPGSGGDDAATGTPTAPGE